MNRVHFGRRAVPNRIPHERGDEPAVGATSLPEYNVFPTSVGMNRDSQSALGGLQRIPHERGDEPGQACAEDLLRRYSPRAWG